jgi:hypothetical protein
MSSESTDSDIRAIQAAVEDYYGGWYEANAERIGRSLHPSLAKRAIKRDEAGKESLRDLTREMMVNATKRGGGTDAPADKRHWSISIVDYYEEIALAKVTCPEYVEYIELARQNGQWLILNVLWTENRAGR